MDILDTPAHIVDPQFFKTKEGWYELDEMKKLIETDPAINLYNTLQAENKFYVQHPKFSATPQREIIRHKALESKNKVLLLHGIYSLLSGRPNKEKRFWHQEGAGVFYAKIVDLPEDTTNIDNLSLDGRFFNAAVEWMNEEIAKGGSVLYRHYSAEDYRKIIDSLISACSTEAC